MNNNPIGKYRNEKLTCINNKQILLMLENVHNKYHHYNINLVYISKQLKSFIKILLFLTKNSPYIPVRRSQKSPLKPNKLIQRKLNPKFKIFNLYIPPTRRISWTYNITTKSNKNDLKKKPTII